MNIGIAVVHGVGAPARGETVDEVVEALCGRNPRLRLQSRATRPPPASRDGCESRDHDPAERIVQRQIVDDRSGVKLFFSEVFWADLSDAARGPTGLLVAFGALLMGLHALVFAGGGMRRSGRIPRTWALAGFWPRATYGVSLVGAYHLKGAVIPLAGLLALLAALSAALGGPPSGTILAVSVLLAGLLALWLPDPSASAPGEPRGRWVKPTVGLGFWCAVGYLVPICWLLVLSGWLPADRAWAAGLVFSAAFGCSNLLVMRTTDKASWERGPLKILRRVFLCAVAIPWGWVVLESRSASAAPDGAAIRGMVVANLGRAIEGAYHFTLGVAASLVIVALGCSYMARIRAERESQRRRACVTALGYALEGFLWIVITTIGFVLIGRLARFANLGWLGAERYSAGTWLYLTAILIPVGLLATALLLRGQRAKDRPFGIAALAEAWPLHAMLLLTALACLVGVWGPFWSMPSYPALLGESASRFLADFGALVLLGLLAVARLLPEQFRVGLDLVNDVTSLFRGRSWAGGELAEKLVDGGPGRRDVPGGMIGKLTGRVDAVLDQLAEQTDRIVVVGHSQGSVIAAYALGKRPARPTTLLTLGSPLRSFYLRYFPHEFEGVVQAARRSVDSWANLYREDDYVGQSLRLGAEDGLGDAVEDTPIGGSGHTDYWIDSAVLERLEALLVGPAGVAGRGSGT